MHAAYLGDVDSWEHVLPHGGHQLARQRVLREAVQHKLQTGSILLSS